MQKQYVTRYGEGFKTFAEALQSEYDTISNYTNLALWMKDSKGALVTDFEKAYELCCNKEGAELIEDEWGAAEEIRFPWPLGLPTYGHWMWSEDGDWVSSEAITENMPAKEVVKHCNSYFRWDCVGRCPLATVCKEYNS